MMQVKVFDLDDPAIPEAGIQRRRQHPHLTSAGLVESTDDGQVIFTRLFNELGPAPEPIDDPTCCHSPRVNHQLTAR
jgi:hypothetical protein